MKNNLLKKSVSSWFIDILTDNPENEHKLRKMSPRTRADIQGHGSILAWIVILSVYGADTIAEVKLLISPFLRWSLDLWNWLLGF